MSRSCRPPLVALLVAAVSAVAGGQDAQSPAADPAGAGRYGYRPEGREPDAVDARFPQNPERVRQLRAIGRAVDAKDWDRAGDALLFLLGEAGGEVVRLSDGAAASVEAEARRLLDRFPADERRALRDRLSGAAGAALERAGRDPGALRDVLLTFPLTDAAARAADRLAALHLERGEPLPAVRLGRRVLEVDRLGPAPAFTADPRWRVRQVAAFARAEGLFASAEEVWELIPEADRQALLAELPGGADPETGLPTALLAPPKTDEPPAVGDPLPVVRWAVPVVADPAARAAAREAADGVRRAGGPLLPAWRPAGAAGLTLARTTAGAVAVDAATGAVRWRTEPDDRRAGVSVYDSRLRGRRGDGGRLPGASDPVVAAMARDAAAGGLSSDGTRLFLLERGADPPGRTYYYGRSDAAPVRLAAYRLADGRRDWEIGGAERGEVFDRPLAGWRVLGVPVADGGDLFCVAERVAAAGKKRIALFCLDPATGEPRWDVTVAFADAAIEDDRVRAQYGVQVAVAGGVVVAPSGVGWVAGVDRLTRETLWVRRAAETRAQPPNRRGRFRFPGRGNDDGQVRRETLGNFWTPGPPLVTGRVVVFTPPAEDRYYGFDLLTGDPVWRPRRRGSWLALAGLLPHGLFGERDPRARERAERGVAPLSGAAVLVGGRSVAAVSLGRDADRLWTVECAPTGLPLVAGGRVFVPSAGGRLLTIDAATGDVLRDARRGPAGGELGTLGAAGGRLTALGPAGLLGFEDDAELAAALAAAERNADRGGELPADLRLRAAERLRATGDPAAALAELDRLGGVGERGESREREVAARARGLRAELLRELALAAETPADRRATLDRLAAAAAGNEAEEIAAARLRAHVLADDDPAAAVGVWRGLLAGRLGPAADRPDPLVPFDPAGGPPPPAAAPGDPPPDAEARLSRVAARALRGLHASGGPGAAAVDALAADLLAAGGGGADDGDANAARPDSAAAAAVPWHPAVRAARLRWCEGALSGAFPGFSSFPKVNAGRPGDAGRAEIDLRRLAAGPGDDVAEAAADLLDRLAAADPAGERTGRGPFDVVAEALPPAAPTPDPDDRLPAPAADRAFFRSHALLSAGGGGRVDVAGPGGAVVARLPLRGVVGGGGSRGVRADFGGGFDFGRADFRRGVSTPSAAAVGGAVFFVTGGAVTATHPATGAVLWAADVPAAAGAGTDAGAAFGRPTRGAAEPPGLRPVTDVRNRSRPRDGVRAVTAQNAYARDGRTLAAVDALTGRAAWVRRRLPAGFEVVATDTAAVLTDDSLGGDGLVLDGADGATAERPGAGRAAARAVAAAGAGVVTAERISGIFDLLVPNTNLAVLKSRDPLSGRALWTLNVSGGTRTAVLPDSLGDPHAVLVRPPLPGETGPGDAPNRRASLVNLRTGALTKLGTVGGTSGSLSVAADAGAVYLFNRVSNSRPRPRVDAEAVGGPVEAFARTGGRLWRANLPGTFLVDAGADRLPFLTFLKPDPEADEDEGSAEIRRTELIALDKRTGREAMRTVVPTLSQFREAAADPAGEALHLWTRARSPATGRPDTTEHWRLTTRPRVGGG